MTGKLGAFRTSDAAIGYAKLYAAFVNDLWPVAHNELDVDTRFGRTHIRRSGNTDGVPLLLVHPTSGSSLGWCSVVAAMSVDRPVLTPDTIGTAGRSVQTAPIRSEGDLSQWLDDVLDAMALEAVHLVGYSEGGWIATLHAALTERTDRLATLTLIEPSGAIDRIPTLTLIRLIIKAMGTIRARDKAKALRDFNRWMNGDVSLSDREIELVLHVFANYRQHLPRPGRLTDEQLGRIKTPTLLLLGEDSIVLDSKSVAERAERLLPNAKIDITPNAGHGLLFQHPRAIVAKILDFVNSHELQG